MATVPQREIERRAKRALHRRMAEGNMVKRRLPNGRIVLVRSRVPSMGRP